VSGDIGCVELAARQRRVDVFILGKVDNLNIA
jgi:hypothetical protein